MNTANRGLDKRLLGQGILHLGIRIYLRLKVSLSLEVVRHFLLIGLFQKDKNLIIEGAVLQSGKNCECNWVIL